MSRKIQVATALLILSLLACGSLNASPLGHQALPGATGSGVLATLVEWIGSLLPWGHPHGKAPHQSQSKGTFTVDPNGGPH